MPQSTPDFHETVVGAETSYRLEGDISRVQFELAEANWRVDDIHEDHLTLASCHESPLAEVVVDLSPEQARRLAHVLNEAADLVSNGLGGRE